MFSSSEDDDDDDDYEDYENRQNQRRQRAQTKDEALYGNSQKKRTKKYAPTTCDKFNMLLLLGFFSFNYLLGKIPPELGILEIMQGKKKKKKRRRRRRGRVLNGSQQNDFCVLCLSVCVCF